MKSLIKAYLKSIPKDRRDLRIIFLGKRLKFKQINYLHFNNHPYELER